LKRLAFVTNEEQDARNC